MKTSKGIVVLRALGFMLLFAVGGLTLTLLWSWAITGHLLFTGHDPFLTCAPPSLTEELAIKAMNTVAHEVLALEEHQVRSVGFSRDEEERWPTFEGTFIVKEEGRERRYFLQGNGCGVEITASGASITVRVRLPANTVYSIRRE